MQCLVLNASYEPMTKPISYKAATRLILQGKADLVEATEDGKAFKAEKVEMPKPAVIRLRRMIKVPRNLRKGVTNTFLFARDNYTCQYCGRTDKQLKERESLNRDHVLPQSRGGKNTWENCVTSCSTCNSRKDAKTPAEAGMKLLRKPFEPELVALRWHVRKLTPLQRKYVEMFYGPEWNKYEV